MTRHRNRTAARLSDRLYRASDVIPSIQEHLDEQRALIAVIGAAKTDGSGGGSKGDHSDPPARALLQLARIDEKGQAITDALASIDIGINLLDEACRDALGHQVRREPGEEAKPRCIGDNTAAGATCWQIPVERRDRNTDGAVNDGRCLDCGRRVDERKAADAERKRKQRSSAA